MRSSDDCRLYTASSGSEGKFGPNDHREDTLHFTNKMSFLTQSFANNLTTSCPSLARPTEKSHLGDFGQSGQNKTKGNVRMDNARVKSLQSGKR